jgi:hypothetical protein
MVPPPVVVPAWAALRASCAGTPAAQEAVLKLQGAAQPVLADVSNARAAHDLRDQRPRSSRTRHADHAFLVRDAGQSHQRRDEHHRRP